MFSSRLFKILSVIILLFLLPNWIHAQLVINEGSNRNYAAIADENGDYPDWIEIYNAGTDTVQLLNYSLTDDPAIPTKWTFPNIQLLPNQYLVVFCSGKDRKPLAGFVNVLSETNYNPTVGWNQHVFNTPFIWDGVSSILINVCSYRIGYTTNSVFNQSPTSYNSTLFAYNDGSEASCQALYGFNAALRPNIKLNNTVIGTGTIQNSPYDYPAPYGNWYWSAKNQMIFPAAELIAAGLQPGPITDMAFDVAGTDPGTVYQYIDISMKPVPYNEVNTTFEPVDTSLRLHTNFKIDKAGEFVYLYDTAQVLQSNLLVSTEQPDVTTGYFPNANVNAPAVLFQGGSPGASNNLSVAYSSYLLPPAINIASGFFNAPQTFSMVNPNGTGSVIRYTLDGSDPKPNSSIYNGTPISLFFSSVIKARAFSSTSLPSTVSSATCFFGVSHTTPVLSVITDPQNLYGSNGIFDNWQFDWERAAYVEYFDTLNQLIFSQQAGMQVDGGLGGSRSQPQKSFRIELDHPVLGAGPVNYPIIPNRPNRTKYSKLYLRNGSNYFLSLPFKDAAHLENMGAETFNYYSAWRPVSVYINGAYFGLYELREKFDAEYFEEQEGADGDSLDLLSLSAWNYYVLRAVEGSVDSFYVDYNDFNTLNPADTGYWNAADNYFDLQYYTDYIIGETYVGNVDWPQNNIKIYRSNTTGFRWRFCLIDLEGSMNPFGFSNAYDDHIGYVLGANPANPFINVFLKSIQNARYRNYFINRYADLMNTSYQYDRLESVANSMFNQTAVEMPREYMRWGDPNNINGQMASFQNNHQTLLSEYGVRTIEVRNDIQNNFSLSGQVDVTLDVEPIGAGKIQISTIVPDSLPWTGVYFNGNPVRITALPNPGYTFSHWEITGSGPTIVNTNISLQVNIPSTTLFEAFFNGGPSSVIQNSDAANVLQLYPNPSSGIVYMQIDSPIGSPIAGIVDVYDFTGAKVYESKVDDLNTPFQIDLSDMAGGVYLIKVNYAGESYMRKVLIK
ncbi:MAG: CotH kinase family protein [Arcticibacter sp.]